MMQASFVHPTAIVEDGAVVGDGTRVWAFAQIRSTATVGANCTFGRNSFVDAEVTVGDNVKVQNNASLFTGCEIEDGVFIGPHVILTNDKIPRAVNPDGSLKSAADWAMGRIRVRRGAAVGAGCVVLTDVTIGEWAMVGSGAIVTADVPDHALVIGNPARIVGWVDAAGERVASQNAARCG